ncbi:hypothetical protein BU17DRAFT_50693 [Hysterangium stoloniferum]|nr:hypothetical protein BU17DRAFT_50693 [Hysterangium stoloniferum]
MASIIAKHAVHAFNREKPHSSITDWIDILTSSRYEVEAYDGIPEVVDSINLQAEGTAEASRAIRKKLKHGDVHHQLRALVILKALVENCGQRFQSSFADDRLTDAIKQLAIDPTGDPAVKKKVLIVLASWKRQFQDDPKMKLVASLFDQCRPTTHRKSAEHSAQPVVSEEYAAREREREREREERGAAKREKEAAKIRARREKEEERQRKSKDARRPKRKPFNFEQEKPQVLATIASASHASSNLVNALMLVNRELEPVETNARVQECLTAAKTVRKQIVRYIQLVEDEELIGTLLETNERIIHALEMYDKVSRTVFFLKVVLSRTTLADGNGSISELSKLQDKQRMAVARAQRPRGAVGGSNVHADLQDLDFGTLSSDDAGLPPPLRPNRPDSPMDENGQGRGSLSDFSDYDSSDEAPYNRYRRGSGSASPVKGKARALFKSFSDEDLAGEGVVNRQALLDDSDPFADPEVPTPGVSSKSQFNWP